MRRGSALALAALLAVARTAGAAPTAHSLRDSLPPDAKSAYLEGRALFRDGDAAGALVQFAQAYAIAKDPRLLWNEAVCEKGLRHYANVRRLLARYVAEGSALLTADDRAEADELAAAIEPFTTALAITSSPEGADVTIDGETVGATPLAAPVVVDIGVHVVALTKPGFRPWAQEITVGERRAEAVHAPLVAAGGAVTVAAPAGASVAFDGAVVGKGTVTAPLAVGGHSLRVTAPGFLPYESDVVVEDGATRRVEVALVRDARDPRSSELRVSVGCGDPDPRTFADGIAIRVDDLPASDGEVVDGYDEAEQRKTVDFLRLRVTPGKHVVKVAIPGCVASETRVVAYDDAPAAVRGSLDRAEREMLRGPSGTPSGWRVAFSGLLNVPVGSFPGAQLGVATGATGSAGLVSRWFVLLADAGLSSGQVTNAYGLFDSNHLLVHLRAGLRAPLHAVAVSAGAALGIETIDHVIDATSIGVIGGWASVDFHPTCHWAIPFSATWTDPAGGSMVAFQLGVAFQPNHRCEREASTVHGL
jgi:hypothetical protein